MVFGEQAAAARVYLPNALPLAIGRHFAQYFQ
jgi:hypothetical protein